MRVLLLNLPNKEKIIRRARCSYKAFGFCYPPIELLYLSGILKYWNKEDFVIIDAIAENKSVDYILDYVKKESFDIIVFIASFEYIDQDLQVVELLRETLPKCTIICFGYFPTIYAEEILRCSSVDIILMGEPEISFSEVCDNLRDAVDLENTDGIAFRKNGRIKINKLRNRIKDLDILPFPPRELLNNALYCEPFAPRPFTTIVTSRGCRYKCKHCIQPYGPSVSIRSAASVINEIIMLFSNFGTKCIRFCDDDFFVSRERVINICRILIKERIKISWICLARVDDIDRELCDIMREAGCIRLDIGIESGSDRMLQYFKKGYSVDIIKKQIKIIRNSGIQVSAKFIIGGNYEEDDDFERTLELIKNLPFNFVEASMLRLYPGTPLFADSKTNIRFNIFPYENLLVGHNVKKDLEKEKKFFKSYYFNLVIIWRLIKLYFSFPRDFLLISIKLLFYIIDPFYVNRSRKDFS